jgi:hypothetical protein
MLGTWDVKVSVGSMPEKIATALANFKIVGAEYTPIAYLGSQVVNGVNHAVMAEQTITTGVDTKNVVVLKFNEKPEGVICYNIESVVEGGGRLGGTHIDVQTEIPEDAKAIFESAMAYFVGSNVKPFAFLGTKVVNGTEYKYAAEVSPITQNPVKHVSIVTINSLTKDVKFETVL